MGFKRPERTQRPPRWRFDLTQLIAEVYADLDSGYHVSSSGVSLENKRSCDFFLFVPSSILRFAPFIARHTINPMRITHNKSLLGSGLKHLVMRSYPHRMGRSSDAAQESRRCRRGVGDLTLLRLHLLSSRLMQPFMWKARLHVLDTHVPYGVQS